MSSNKQVSIFWFRRDLRLEDNAGLYHALKKGVPVLPIFIFDKLILNKLQDKRDSRISFIYKALQNINAELKKYASGLLIRCGHPAEVWQKLLSEFDVVSVYTNRDYETYAKKRDLEISSLLNSAGIEYNDYKDHVIFDRDEVLKKDGTPYTVFTPYSKVGRQN